MSKAERTLERYNDDVEGKYTSVSQLERIARDGSEPARFAFEGSRIAFSNIAGLDDLLARIVKYPLERKVQNIGRFYAQLEAWKWYCDEALKQENRYLLNHSVSNLILFCGRLVLAHNEVLYPYHKWFLKVLEGVDQKPVDLMEAIHGLLDKSDGARVSRLYQTVREYREWERPDKSWPSTFMYDSELNWMSGNTPVADL